MILKTIANLLIESVESQGVFLSEIDKGAVETLFGHSLGLEGVP